MSGHCGYSNVICCKIIQVFHIPEGEVFAGFREEKLVGGPVRTLTQVGCKVFTAFQT
jgi:hypothetical protein